MKMSKGEEAVGKVINEALDCHYVQGGYYSFLLSPRGYPMQYDYLIIDVVRGMLRPLFAVEYQGIQHKKPIYGEDTLKYQQICDKEKQVLSDNMGVTVVYFYHDEDVTVENLLHKLHQHKLLKKLAVRGLLNNSVIDMAKSILRLI